jgi:hypothetical protein
MRNLNQITVLTKTTGKGTNDETTEIKMAFLPKNVDVAKERVNLLNEEAGEDVEFNLTQLDVYVPKSRRKSDDSDEPVKAASTKKDKSNARRPAGKAKESLEM